MNRSTSRPWTIKSGILIAVFISCMTGIAGYCRFFVVHNDFWGNYYLSQHFSFSRVSTWLDDLYPCGYTMVLKVISGSAYPVPAAIFLNTMLSSLVVGALLLLFRAFRFPFRFAPATVLFVVLFPRMFHYFCAAGADAGAVAFFSLGAALLFARDAFRGRRGFAFAGGIALGLAGIWRSHAEYSALIFIALYFVFYERSIKSLLCTLIGFALPSSLQWFAMAGGAESHHPVFGYYIWNLMYPINWYHAADVEPPASALALILRDPALFAGHYLSLLTISLLPVAAAPALFAAIVLRQCRKAAFHPDEPDEAQPGSECAAPENSARLVQACGIWCAFSIIYCCMVAAGASSRALLLPVPLTFFFLAASLITLVARLPSWQRRSNLLCAGIGLVMIVFVQRDVHKIHLWRETARTYEAVETAAMDAGVMRAGEIFTTDFDLYFHRLRPFRPIMNGGWLKFRIYRSNGLLPDFNISSGDSLRKDCLKYQVKCLCLSKDAARASLFLGNLYACPGSSPQFRLVREIGEEKLFIVR